MKDVTRRVVPAGSWICGALLFLSAGSAEILSAAQATSPGSWLVVANADVEGTKVSRGALADIYLGRVVKWGNGQKINAVDQSARSPIRAEFAQSVLGKPVPEVLAYWRTAMVHGLRPPKVKGSDEDVLAYVTSTPGAIGYISQSASLDGVSVKVLEVLAD
jgi:ABC-type phosphate transport system substrate-binding protein